jgi:hypothetical protein
MLKAEYDFNRETGFKLDNDTLLVQVSLLF